MMMMGIERDSRDRAEHREAEARWEEWRIQAEIEH
jgi:hypothetical protein